MMPRAKKSFGQNFLVDRSVVGKIVALSWIVPGEAVLEIGPGTGALTGALVAAGAKVTAVEADHDLIAPLREKFGETVEIVEADILNYQLPTTSYKLIANIPYNITSDILFTFLTAEYPPSCLVLMVQREVAQRIAAKPPDMSLLSVVCQLYARVGQIVFVPAGAFRPAPKVDSSVIRLDVRPRDASVDPESVIRLAKAGFSARRKQLHGNIAGAGIASSQAVKDALASIGLPPTARAETLTVDHWIALRRLL